MIKKISLVVLDPADMRYWTVGDYVETEDELKFFVADQGNEDANMLIFIHEFVEFILTRKRGIKEQDIMDFDLQWERKDASGETVADEAGDEPDCPYRKEHRFSENIERLLAAELDFNWADYENLITTNWEAMPQNPHGKSEK